LGKRQTGIRSLYRRKIRVGLAYHAWVRPSISFTLILSAQ
jgi:hypothetical protein